MRQFLEWGPDRLDWYEQGFGWPTTGSIPPVLLTGVRFDVLEAPAPAGFEVLARFPRTGPVALDGTRVRFLVAAGCAEELPGLLDWLEWGGIPLDLVALGPGGRMPAPAPPAPPVSGRAPRRATGGAASEATDGAGQGAAHGRTDPVWLRPPVPGLGAEPPLPALTFARTGAPGPGGPRDADSGTGSVSDPGPDPGPRPGPVVGLVALVSALANSCHRLRLLSGRQQSLGPSAQPCSLSYASRMVAGTRPRSLTS